MDKTKKISLVLGGGGARGLAHIGVIRALQELGYEIDEVVGCSIGALIGGLYAKGNLDELEKWMLNLNRKTVFNLMDFTFENSGLMKGTRVLSTLEEVMPDVKIEDCDVLFKAVATDLISEKEYVFDKGSLYQAIRASISIPGVFTAVQYQHKMLVDGGVLNPLPINHVTKSENMIVAVNLSGPDLISGGLANQDMKKTYTSIDMLQKSYYLMHKNISNLIISLYQPDCLINIPQNICGIWDYSKAKFLIDAGKSYCKKALK